MTDVFIVLAWLGLLVVFVVLRVRATRGPAKRPADPSTLARFEHELGSRVEGPPVRTVTPRRRRAA